MLDVVSCVLAVEVVIDEVMVVAGNVESVAVCVVEVVVLCCTVELGVVEIMLVVVLVLDVVLVVAGNVKSVVVVEVVAEVVVVGSAVVGVVEGVDVLMFKKSSPLAVKVVNLCNVIIIL